MATLDLKKTYKHLYAPSAKASSVVVEVLSPGNSAEEKANKRTMYARGGHGSQPYPYPYRFIVGTSAADGACSAPLIASHRQTR
jgi:hypothetical protein